MCRCKLVLKLFDTIRHIIPSMHLIKKGSTRENMTEEEAVKKRGQDEGSSENSAMNVNECHVKN